MKQNKQDTGERKAPRIVGRIKYTYVRVQMQVGSMVRIRAIAPDGSETITFYHVAKTKKQFARLEAADGSVLEIKT